MEPIISPWLIYLLGIMYDLKIVSMFFMFVSGCGLIAYIIVKSCKGTKEQSSYHIWEPALENARAKLKLFCWIFPLFLFLSIAFPSEKTLIGMIVAQQITPKNIESAIKTGKDFKNEIKKDVIDIIQSVTKEKETGKK